MMQTEAQDRLERLLSYLEHDPANPALLRDTAQAAMEAGELALVKELFARLKETGGLTDADSNLWAIAAMRSGEPGLAAETFAGLLEATPEDSALRFNLAWARALAGDETGSRELLDERLAEELPQAALLEIQLMHGAGEFDAALARTRSHIARHGGYAPLLAAASVLALDVDDEEFARDCAEGAGGHPDALTTLATLSLGAGEATQARAMFEQALSMNAGSPRAWIGLGLTDLVAGNSAAAGASIDRGAEIFGDHSGSWIAAGWAYLIAGDLSKAHERFAHAVALDGDTADGHGSLAVVELLMGDREAAQHRLEAAQRLDDESAMVAFARILFNSAAGDREQASRILENALQQKVGQGGKTIADVIARMAR